MQGWYRWCHDQTGFMRKLTNILEAHRLETNGASVITSQQLIRFVRQQGEARSSSTREGSLLSGEVPPQKKQKQKNTTTSVRPDILLWSTSVRAVMSGNRGCLEKYTELVGGCSLVGGGRSPILSFQRIISCGRLSETWQRRQNKGTSGS